MGIVFIYQKSFMTHIWKLRIFQKTLLFLEILANIFQGFYKMMLTILLESQPSCEYSIIRKDSRPEICLAVGF